MIRHREYVGILNNVYLCRYIEPRISKNTYIKILTVLMCYYRRGGGLTRNGAVDWHGQIVYSKWT